MTKPGDVIDVKINGKSYRTVIDDRGVQRFDIGPASDVVNWLFKQNQLDLNQLAVDFQQGKFPLEAYMEFYMLLGYSVSGMYDLSWMQDVSIENPLWD